MQHRRHSTTAGPTDKRQRECYIIWQVSLVRLNGPYCLRLFGYERGKDGFSPTASASFQVGPRRDCGHAGLLSHLRVVIGRLGSRPRSEQTSSPSTFIPLGEHKMALCRPACFRSRKPPTVFSGSCLFPAISTGSTAFGFCPGIACRFFKQHDREHPCRPRRWALGGSG